MTSSRACMSIVMMTAVGCSQPAVAPAPKAPTPPASPKAPVSTAPAHEDTPPASSWTACLFTKTVVEGDTHRPVDDIPSSGFLLVLGYVQRDGDNEHAFIARIPLASAPSSSPAKVAGAMRDSLREMEGGIETTYEIHGQLASTKDGIDLTLASTEQPHMFDPGSPLEHIVTPLRRVEHLADCSWK